MIFMTLQKKLKTFRDALTGLKVSVFHYRRRKMQPPFAVWQEDGEGDSLHTGNRKTEQVITGTLDYFTLTEYDDVIDQIQDALNASCTAWRLESVQYEEETNMIHYEWAWELGYGTD